MTDKVQLIKEEIERRIEKYGPDFKTPYDAMYQLLTLLDFIDSLPEEPASEDRINECLNWDKDYGCSTSPMNNCDTCPHAKWVEVKEEKKNYNERYNRIAQTEQFKKSYCDKSLGKEEPTSEDLDYLVISLEETIGTSPHSREVIKEHLQRAAIWQKQQMKEALQTEYEKGRFDMREEMLKESISCNIDWYDGFRLDYTQEQQDDILLKLRADVGDKVKIIIVKEEQQ